MAETPIETDDSGAQNGDDRRTEIEVFGRTYEVLDPDPIVDDGRVRRHD
jgi:hypothetical protein